MTIEKLQKRISEDLIKQIEDYREIGSGKFFEHRIKRIEGKIFKLKSAIKWYNPFTWQIITRDEAVHEYNNIIDEYNTFSKRVDVKDILIQLLIEDYRGRIYEQYNTGEDYG